MEKEKFQKFLKGLEPEEFVAFVNGGKIPKYEDTKINYNIYAQEEQINRLNKKDLKLQEILIKQYRQEEYDRQIIQHLTDIINSGEYLEKVFAKGEDISIVGPHKKPATIFTYETFLNLKNEKYCSAIANLIFEQIIKIVEEDFYHGSTPSIAGTRFPKRKMLYSRIDLIDNSFKLLMTRRKYFTDSQIQEFADKFVETLYKRLTYPRIIDTEFIVPLYKYYKMNGIRVADAKMIYKIATQCKNIKIEKLQKVILDMKLHKDDIDSNYYCVDEDYDAQSYDYDLREYQKVLFDFSKIEGADKNKFAQKFLEGKWSYDTNVAVEFAYNTPTLNEDYKDKFKQIVINQNYKLYEENEKNLIIKQQKQQRKIEIQKVRTKIFQKLSFSKKASLKQEIQEQEKTQGK